MLDKGPGTSCLPEQTHARLLQTIDIMRFSFAQMLCEKCVVCTCVIRLRSQPSIQLSTTHQSLYASTLQEKVFAQFFS